MRVELEKDEIRALIEKAQIHPRNSPIGRAVRKLLRALECGK